MMNSTVVVLTVLVAALGIAYIIGRLLTLRAGLMKEVVPAETSAENDNADLGLSTTGPTVVHFSATWCGPCAAVRRVVDQVCDDLGVAHVELDLDANPVAARRLSVLSLPTTFIFDAAGQQRYRTAGVPKSADLREALLPLLA
nr:MULTISPECIES: thioredoxin family protein [unclassified Mycolicibacterium]